MVPKIVFNNSIFNGLKVKCACVDMFCSCVQCTWPYTLEEMTALFQRSTQYLGTPEAQSTPIKTPTRR